MDLGCTAGGCAAPAVAQRPVSATAYVGFGPGSSSGNFGWGVAHGGIDLESPITSTIDGTIDLGAFAIGAVCEDSCDLTGWIVAAGVSRVFGARAISPFVAATAGVYKLDRAGFTGGARAGLQFGRATALRIGMRVEAFPRDDLVAFPAFLGLRIAFR